MKYYNKSTNEFLGQRKNPNFHFYCPFAHMYGETKDQLVKRLHSECVPSKNTLIRMKFHGCSDVELTKYVAQQESVFQRCVDEIIEVEAR